MNYLVTCNGRRITMRDDTLRHQVRLHLDRLGHRITVGCSCSAEVLETRERWEAHEALEVWVGHVAALETAGAS